MTARIYGQLDTLTTLTWKIENISNYLKDKASLTSQEFKCHNLMWQLVLNFENSNEGAIDFGLLLVNPGRTFTTNASFSILNSQGKKCYQRIIGLIEFENPTARGQDIITKNDLFNNKDTLISNDELTIVCEIFLGECNAHNETWCDFNDVLTGGCFSDFELIVKGQRLYSHKIVLSRKSDVFAAMLKHNVVESTSNSVVIDDIEYEVAVEMLRFMYTGEVKNIEKVVEDLLIAADKYALLDLKDICENHLISTITQQNCIQYLDFAICHNCKGLKIHTQSFIIKNAPQMTQLPEFKTILNLQDDVLLDIICKLSTRRSYHKRKRDNDS